MKITLQPEPTVQFMIEGVVNNPEDFIADRILPVATSTSLTGYFGRLLQGAGRIINTVVKGVSKNTVNYEFDTNATFEVTDHSLETPIDRADAERFGGWDQAKQLNGLLLADSLLKSREHAIASYLTDITKITNYITLTGSDQWTTPTSEVLGRVKTAKKAVAAATGKPANLIIMGYPTFMTLQNHPQIIAVLSPGKATPGVYTKEQMAAAFGVERVEVGMATYDTAKEGQTESDAFIWGDNLIVCRVEKSGEQARVSKSLGAQVKCPTKAPDVYAGSYIPEGKNSDQVQVIVAGRNWEDRIITATAAYLIKDTDAA